MKRNKILTAILGIAILSGIICSGVVIAQGIQAGKNQPQQSRTHQREKIDVPQAWKLEKTKLEKFSEASISIDYSNFSILPADDYYLEYRLDGSSSEPQYEISNGKFSFREGETQPKYFSGFHFFFNSGSFSSNQGPFYMNLYVPEEHYFDLLEITTESGDVELGDLQGKQVDINADYGSLNLKSFQGENLSILAESGNIEIGDINCENLNFRDEYGNISGGSFQVSRETTIKLESGNLDLAKLDTDSLTLTNAYGQCSIDETTLKNSNIFMESGNLTLHKSSLGMTEIHSSYGDVTLNLADDISDYNYDLNTEYGGVSLNNETLTMNEDNEIHYQKDNGQKSEIRITCESGNIKIR